MNDRTFCSLTSFVNGQLCAYDNIWLTGRRETGMQAAGKIVFLTKYPGLE